MENEESQSPPPPVKPKATNKWKIIIILVVVVAVILIFARSSVENALNAIALEVVKKTIGGLFAPFVGD